MSLVYSSLHFAPAPQEWSDTALCPKEAFIVRNMVSGGGCAIKTVQSDRVKAFTHQQGMGATTPQAVFHPALQTMVNLMEVNSAILIP